MSPKSRKTKQTKSGRMNTSKQRQSNSLGRGIVSNMLSFAASHPSLVGGGTVFCVVFVFVTANALYYQKDRHPAPILQMRETEQLISGSTRTPRHIRQQREKTIETVLRSRATDDLNATDQRVRTTASIPRPVVTSGQAPSNATSAQQIVRDIQNELARRDLYKDVVDGLMGPKTMTAIKQFEIQNGWPVTGNASIEFLEKIKQKNNSPAAIREMTKLIQTGLKRAHYPHVEVDGIMGEQTKTAIEDFERRSGLKVTGVPNQAIINKLRSMGALDAT